MSGNERQEKGSMIKAAHTCYTAAGIINGAAGGGVKGAAVAAAGTLIPMILKAVICLMVLAVLIPFFIFVSLTGDLFQFPSVTAPDIVAMNEQAAEVGAMYRRFDEFTRSEADDIITRLSQGYDDVVVTEDFGHTNHNWLTSISSVFHDQNIHSITESSVRNIVRANIEYSYWVEAYQESGGGGDEEEEDEGETLYRIHIDLWDIGPQALTSKLGFDLFHTKWAGFLYDNLSESQTIDPNAPDYSGDMPGIEIGDLTFTDGSREVIYWSQMDKRWCNELYGKTQTIGYAGCGPSALAIVVSTLTESSMTPKEMADWAYENGYCCEGEGSYRSLIPEGAEKYRLPVEGASKSDAQKIIDALAAQKLVVAIMGPGHFTNDGHFIVLRGVTADGDFLVADPASLSKSEKEWDAGLIFSEARNSNAAGGPFWIIG